MFTNSSNLTFKIILPSSTNKDVIEWFEEMDDKCKLADALVGMVYDSLKTKAHIKTSQFVNYNGNKPTPEKTGADQGDLFDNLYNWQDSNSAIFLEDKSAVNKAKKKMLCV